MLDFAQIFWHQKNVEEKKKKKKKPSIDVWYGVSDFQKTNKIRLSRV